MLCKTFQFVDRGAPDSVLIYEINEVVTGLAITYPDIQNTLVTAGKADGAEKEEILFEEGQVLAGLFGAINEDSIT